MDVDPVREGLLQLRDVAYVGQEPQLDLRVVGADQHMARLGDEGLADLAAFLGADRDVLQVGIGRRQPAGRGRGQGVGGVDPVGLRIDRRHQVVGVGALQLRELAPVQQDARQLVALCGQVLQHRRVGGRSARGGGAAGGQAHLPEQQVADLLGRAQVERPAGDAVGLEFELAHPNREVVGEQPKPLRVDLDPGQLHLDQHLGHGAFERLVDGQQLFARQARPQVLVDPQGDIRVLGRVAGRRAQLDMLEALLGLARPGHRLEGDRLVAQQALGKLVHAVALVQPALEREGDQHGVVHRPDLDAVAGEDGQVVLAVLGDLQDGRRFQQRLQPRDRVCEGDLGEFDRRVELQAALLLLLMADGDVAGLARRRGQRDAAEVGAGGRQGVGLGVEGHDPLRKGPRDPGVEGRQVAHALIGVDVDGPVLGGFRRLGRGRRRGRGRLAAPRLGHPAGERAELHHLQEGRQGLGVGVLDAQVVDRRRQGGVAVELHQLAR